MQSEGGLINGEIRKSSGIKIRISRRSLPDIHSSCSEKEIEEAAEMVYATALYLCIWGEAGNFRFTPELICFLYMCASGYGREGKKEALPEKFFLNKIMKPLYDFLFNQSHYWKGQRVFPKAKDHCDKILYDDVNETFWSVKSIQKITTQNGECIVGDVPVDCRYEMLQNVNWSLVFEKTFVEHRTVLHLLVNHSKVWALYISIFVLAVGLSTDPLNYVGWAGLGANCGIWLFIFAQMIEGYFVTDRKPHAFRLGMYMFGLLGQLLSLALVEILFEDEVEDLSKLALASYSGALFAFLLLTPRRAWPFEEETVFSGNWVCQPSSHNIASVLFWMLLFAVKTLFDVFSMQYTFTSPYQGLMDLKLQICRDILCELSIYCMVVMLLLLNFMLSLTGGNVWYIIFMSIVGFVRGLKLGLRKSSATTGIMFSGLWKRMSSKLVVCDDAKSRQDDKAKIAPLWNAMIDDMWSESLLSKGERDDLKFKTVPSYRSNQPPLLIEPRGLKDACSGKRICLGKEAERRIQFFVRSLLMKMPRPQSVEEMKSFTCFTPHYNETILYSKDDLMSPNTGPTESLIDYLSKMFKQEWKIFAERENMESSDILRGVTRKSESEKRKKV